MEHGVFSCRKQTHVIIREVIFTVREKRQRVLTLTREILHAYWQGNLEPAKEHLHDDILWIGSMDSEYLHGKQAVLTRLAENVREMPQVFMDQEEYEIVDFDKLTCAVVGRYRAYTAPDSELLLSEKQRVTFIWKNVGGALQIIHLHLSNVLHIQEEDERFPTSAGKVNREYLQQLLQEHQQGDSLTVAAVNGATYSIKYSDIICVTADKNYSVIHRVNSFEEVRLRHPFATMMDDLPNYFHQLSRSVIVNLHMVDKSERGVLYLNDGSTFTVPQAKRAAFQRVMMNAGTV